MSQKDTIHQVAELFHVSPSALRYWDQEGLVRFERSPDNGYRVPSFQTMLDICDVLFARQLHLPLKQVRQLPDMELEEMERALSENERRIREQIAQQQRALSNLHQRQRMLEKVRDLKSRGFTEERTVLPAVVPFSFEDGEQVRAYSRDPSTAGVVLEPEGAGPEIEWVFVLPADKGASPRLCLNGLLWLDAKDPYRNNAGEFAACARELGYRPGKLLGRYLASVREGLRLDYHEAWLELL